MNEGVHKLCPNCGKELVWRPYFHRWICYNKECDYIGEVCGEGEETIVDEDFVCENYD